ncbi:MAG: MFS transporter [Chloroflexota bacterium]|nr:MFS transporter [Chloroflexota bacterium]
MRSLLLVAFGQFISITGSAMTRFGLSVWAWEQTEQATALALVNFFGVLPLLLLSPVAGALVDRWNRKLTMMLSDLGAGVATIGIFILFSAGQLEIWHLYVAAFISGAFEVFQWPAYSAAIALMAPKAQYTRANALFGLAESAATVLAPSLAAALFVGLTLGAQRIEIGLQGILLIDIITFSAAIGTLLLIHVPQPARSPEQAAVQPNLLHESIFGFRYIFSRPSLLGLQLTFMSCNLFTAAALTLITPLILSRTGNDEQALGIVQSMVGIGGILGGLLLTAWGGPKRKVIGVLGSWVVFGVGCLLLFGVGRGLLVWVIASLVNALTAPIINGSNQSIWQSKVPPDIQGKVFSIRRLIAWFVNPIAALIIGPLTDQVVEPGFRDGGALASAFGWLVGTGPGAGMAFIMVLCALGIVLVCLVAWNTRVIRDAETLLPDHDAMRS